MHLYLTEVHYVSLPYSPCYCILQLGTSSIIILLHLSTSSFENGRNSPITNIIKKITTYKL